MSSVGDSYFTPTLYNAAPSLSTGGALPGDNSWAAWFGEPDTAVDLHPIEATNRSTWTLPTAYRGKNKFLGTTFVLLALSSNSFLTNVILPLKSTDQLKFTWTRYEFPAVLPDVVPDLGVVREVKNNFISTGVTMTRYGLGLQMQHGFMTTEEGRACYVFHIRQIYQAMMEMLQFECLHALLNSGNWAINTMTKMGAWNAKTASDAMERALDNECHTWAITQKTKNGDVQMDMHVESITNLSNVQLDTYIMDSRIRTYLKTVAPLSDPNASDNFKFGVGDRYTNNRGKTVYQTRSLLVDGGPFNPLERRAQIGEFVLSKDSTNNIDAYATYISDDRTVSIFSDDENNWKQVSLQECIDASYRFHPSTGYLREFSSKYSIDENMQNREADHLHHRVGGKVQPISFFGQMQPKHFTTDDYEKLSLTALSSAASQNVKLRDKIVTSLDYIHKVLTAMHKVPYDDNYNLWLRALAIANQGTRNNISDNVNSGSSTVEMASNGYNSLNIPTDPAIYTSAFLKPWDQIRGTMALPPTHGSYGGLRTIADLVASGLWTSANVPFNTQLVSQLDKHLGVFERYVAHMVEIFPNSSFSVPRNGSDYFSNPSPQDIIFENFFHLYHPSRVLFVRQANLDAAAITAGGLANGIDQQARTVKAWENAIPDIARGRQRLQARVLGDIYLGIEGQKNIGAYIGADASIVGANAPGNGAEVWRFGRDATLRSKWIGGAVIAPGTAIDVPDAIIITGDADQDKQQNVYWGLMRAAIVPYRQDNTQKDMAAYHAALLALLSSVNQYDTIKGNVDAYDAIFEAIRLKGHADLRAAFPTLPKPVKVAIDDLIAIMKDPATSQYFVPRLLASDFDNVMREYIVAATYAEGVVATPDFRAAAVPADQYVRAPIFMGRAAIQEFVSKGARAAGQYNYGIPASYTRPHTFMTKREIDEARTYSIDARDFLNGANHTKYQNVGEVFEPASRTAARMDITNLPLIKKLVKSFDREMYEAQNDRRINRQEMDSMVSRNFLRNNNDGSTRTRPGLNWTGMNARSNTQSEMSAINVYAPENFSTPEQNVSNDELTPAWKQNFASLVGGLSGVSLLSALFFMFSAVLKSTLDRMNKRNIMHPWNYIIARPHCTWTTLTTIACKPGDQLGNSFLAKVEVETSDDTSVHVFRGNVNYWATAMVKDPNLCMNIHNSYISGYIGGQGVGFINPETYTGSFGTPEDPRASIMCFSVPLHEQLNQRRISITGYPSWYTRDGNTIDVSMAPNSFGYSSAAFYNSHYGFHEIAYGVGVSQDQGPARYRGQTITPNAICFASAGIYRSFTTHEPAFVTPQQGHWDDSQVGTGAHQCRIGRKPFDFSVPSFQSTFTSIGAC